MFDLKSYSHVFIHQRKELAELIGFETRNKYEILNESNQPIGFIAEQSKGVLGFLGRQYLGHWRTFDLHIFDSQRQKLGRATHPFRWFWQRLDLYDHNDQKVGGLQQRFSILSKKFDLEDSHGQVLLTVSSPLWRIWTFIFKGRDQQEKARIEKKWTGLLKEAFTDADNFKITFTDRMLENNIRNTLLVTTVLIDLQYFEKRAGD